jgi:hypothetical protein
VGVEKFAIVVPQDLVAHLSTEQTVGEAPAQVQYFLDRDAAFAWFVE